MSARTYTMWRIDCDCGFCDDYDSEPTECPECGMRIGVEDDEAEESEVKP